MIGLALGALPVVVLYLYVVEPLVNRSRELTELRGRTRRRRPGQKARGLLLECSRRLSQLLGKSGALGDEPSLRLKRRLASEAELQRVVKE